MMGGRSVVVMCGLVLMCAASGSGTAGGRRVSLNSEIAEGFLAPQTSLGMTDFILTGRAPAGEARREECAAEAQPKSTGRNACATQENSAAAQGYTIAGAVVNAVTGAALARVKVSVADTRARMRRIETVTGEGGHFEFAGLPAGKYALEGSRSGYITSGYEQHEQYSTAIVTGPEFATEKLVLRLMPMAMITGHVLDEAGEPVRSARVQLFMEDHSGGMSRVRSAGGATSDDRGYFDIGVLQPGTYFVSANAKPWYAVHPSAARGESARHISPALDVAYATTFYGGATEAENAAPVELKGGEKAEIDIRMSPVPALHLVFGVPVPPEQPEQGRMNQFRIPILQKRVFDTEEYVQPGQMQPVAPGVFEISGIAAGRYDVSIRSADPNEPQQFTEMNLVHDGQDLSSTQGESLGKLKVTVKMPGEEPLPRQYAVGLRDARQRIVAFQPGDANGEVSFQAVRPGKYWIVFAAPGKAYSVARTSSGAGEVAGHEVSVASGGTTEVTAELAGGEVRVEGVVEKNGKPVAGVMVALVPDDPEAHVDLFRRDQSDFDGTFLLQSVVPGRYTIVAVEDAWGFAWLKAGVLARYVQHGQQVIVGEKMRGVLRLPEAVEVQMK